MMEFIRATFPFLYTIPPEKLLVGSAVLVFILFWIKERSFISAIFPTIGSAIIAFIGLVVTEYLFGAFNIIDLLAIALLSIMVLIILSIIIAIIKKIRKAKKEKAFYTCEECGKENALQYVKTTEEDRYIGSKQVYERTAKGNYKTRNVKCTKVVEKKHYECKFCGAGYSTKHTRELS